MCGCWIQRRKKSLTEKLRPRWKCLFTKSNSQVAFSNKQSKETVHKSQQSKSSGQALPNQPSSDNLRKGRGRPRNNKNYSQPSQKVPTKSTSKNSQSQNA